MITVRTKKNDIIGKLIVKPGTVGTDPFTVTFDASTTVINDPTDEIVYFTWDFGDGTGNIKQNTSQAVMTHTYRYDTANENGEYMPIVTIKTKKGREISISPENKIIVKKTIQTLKIDIPDYPAQIAPVGSVINFSLEINGSPIKIEWDFGNGKTFECESRGVCAQISTVYNQPGNYLVKAKITYPDQSVVEGNITLKVQ